MGRSGISKCGVCFSVVSESGKNLYIIGGKQIFQAFEPYLDKIIVTQIHAQVEGDTYFPEEFDLSRFETVASKSYTRDEKTTMILPSNTEIERKSNGAQYIWIFTAFCV